MNRVAAAFAAAVVIGLTTSACADDEPSGTEQRTLTVFAAASLTDTFTEIGKEFEAANDGVDVIFSFAGSSNLVTQIQQGAPADVFASANTANMDKAVDDGLVAGTPTNFATNTLQIVTAPGNPAGVDSLDDLAKPGITVVVCAPQVPCGAAAQRVEDASGVDITPVSEEQSVTDVLNKVRTGQADAGLVYVTDVSGAGDEVGGVKFPESASAVNIYPIAAIAGSEQVELANRFVAFVAGPEGQAVLAAAGFGAPK